MTLTKLLLRPFHSRQGEQGKQSDDGWVKSMELSCHTAVESKFQTVFVFKCDSGGCSSKCVSVSVTRQKQKNPLLLSN